MVDDGAFPKGVEEYLKGAVAEVEAGVAAHRMHWGGCGGADAPEALDGEGGDIVEGLRGVDGADAVGLADVGGDFCEKFVVGYSGGCGEIEMVADFLLDFAGDVDGEGDAGFVDGDVDEGFIEGYGLDDVGIFMKDFVHLG